ncbi:O-antigen ligase family protein [Proteocatella sphenisci]|uniref:O-antigen ligase family protein n=1 Tax=Proteocatella sphenisci TaxID=181070 RepID=UPI00048C3B84|nr:O-antigen ligase family protein [Proteocatella sphenisci]
MSKKKNIAKKAKNKDVAVIVSLKNNKYFNLIEMMPIILIIAMVPFILRLMSNPLDYSMGKVWSSNVESDLYTYGKTIATMIISLGMLVIMYLTFKKDTIKKDGISKVIYSSMGALMLSLLISTLFSDYKDTAIWGAPERHEGLIIHICYAIIFIYTYLSVRKVEDFKYIKWAMIVLATGMAIIGVSQAIGKNIVNTEFVRRLIIPASRYDALEKIDTGKTVYLTLMNQNYVGSYASMVILFFTVLATSKKEDIKIRIASIIIALVTIFVLVKSGSQAGMVGVAAGILAITAVNIKNIIKSPKTLIAVLMAVIIISLSVNIATQGSFVNDIKNTANDARSLFTRDSAYVHDPSYGFAIKDIKFSQDTAEIDTQFGTISTTFNSQGMLELRDENGNDMLASYDAESKKYMLKAPFELIGFNVSKDSEEHHVQTGITYNSQIYFIFEWYAGEGIEMIDHRSNVYEWGPAPHIGFEGKESIGSNRGYIWSRTLPLILNKPIFGYGPDTFILDFPQHDMLAKIHAYGGNIGMITDKPHNMYLLYAVNSGLTGLLAALVLWFAYVVSSFKNIIKSKNKTKAYYYKMACFGAVVAYLATGIFNDSVPVITPVFWVIIAAGYALNYIDKHENAEVSEEFKYEK